jgi:putative N6-adenine-specific DNA methylase
LPWTSFIHPGQPITARAVVRDSRLHFADTVQKKVELAVADALRGPRRAGPRPPREPAQVLVRVDGDRAHLSMDASGELLHRRGWRLETAKAPLRENLAAAVLRIAGFEGEEPLVDPMCGAGTFAIEAAGIALGHLPGAERDFDILRWPCIDARDFVSASRRTPLKGSAPIFGFDRDSGAVETSVRNARRAHVSDRIRFAESDFLRLEPPVDAGLLVANPPYGARVGAGAEATDLYRRMGRVLRERWAGWRVAFVLPDGPSGPAFGLDLERVTGFSNGGLRVGVWCGEV